MKFIILTEAGDAHALFVKLALEKVGYDVQLLFTADQPTKLKYSVFLNNESFQWIGQDEHSFIADNCYDVVWWRRARKPFLPKERVHAEDYKFALRENILFYESLTSNLAPKGRWINPKEAAKRADYKLLQLKTACQSGLLIPVTLCSNNPADIQHFIAQHQKEGMIYKSLSPSFWFENTVLKICYTEKITSFDVGNHELLQFFPGIFQKEVKKEFELRIMCFGEYLVAAKLNSQKHQKGRIDWRVIPPGEMDIEPYQLPEEICKKIRLFMCNMGLEFGCIDMVVNQNGEYIFLEVNEQGQFLWVEECNSEFKLLDIFVQFLLSKTEQYTWDSSRAVHSIKDYNEQIKDHLFHDLKQHVYLNGPTAHLN